jgi:hypothetical protein
LQLCNIQYSGTYICPILLSSTYFILRILCNDFSRVHQVKENCNKENVLLNFQIWKSHLILV